MPLSRSPRSKFVPQRTWGHPCLCFLPPSRAFALCNIVEKPVSWAPLLCQLWPGQERCLAGQMSVKMEACIFSERALREKRRKSKQLAFCLEKPFRNGRANTSFVLMCGDPTYQAPWKCRCFILNRHCLSTWDLTFPRSMWTPLGIFSSLRPLQADGFQEAKPWWLHIRKRVKFHWNQEKNIEWVTSKE